VQTQTPTFRQLILPLAFTLACVVLMIITWRSFGGKTPLQAKPYEVDVRLPSAANLTPGADVRIAGVVVGRIAGVRRDGNRARVTVSLKPRYAPLHQGATVTARTKSLLGEAYLAIDPGPPAAQPVRDGATLPDSHARPSQQLDQVLSTFSAPTRANTRLLFDGLARGLRGHGQDLNDAIGTAAPATADLSRMFTTLEAQRGDLRKLVSSSGVVFDVLGRRQAALRSVIGSGDEVLASTAGRDRALSATIRALPPFLHQLDSTAGALDAASSELSRGVGSLRPVTPQIAPLLRQVTAQGPEFRRLFADLPAVLKSGEEGLPAVGRIAASAKPALGHTYPALREVIPTLQLLGANRNETLAVLGNVASLLNGRMIGPQGRTVAYGTGIPTIWNEVVGGWIHKLPSNRANPYPKPGGLNSIRDKGYVQAYDCRHLGNRPYLPPTGTGVPPCDVQGPWSFDGKSRYFPNLEPAAP
jgi:phospholipid/cholesterol/gamma-HCH transport system substrate-binding protein